MLPGVKSKAWFCAYTILNPTSGVFTGPTAVMASLIRSQVGQFKNGRGDFNALNTINGKNILIRFDWSHI
jgi:hypothetical protein